MNTEELGRGKKTKELRNLERQEAGHAGPEHEETTVGSPETRRVNRAAPEGP